MGRFCGLVQCPPRLAPMRLIYRVTPGTPPLRNKKDLVGVRVFDFGSRRKPPNVDVALIGRVRAGDKAGLVRNWNAIRNIALWLFGGSGGGRLGRGFDGIRGRRRGSVLIGLLRRWRRHLALGWAITRWMTRRMNRRFVLASWKKGHDSGKYKRERRFHRWFDESLSLVIHCSLADNRLLAGPHQGSGAEYPAPFFAGKIQFCHSLFPNHRRRWVQRIMSESW